MTRILLDPENFVWLIASLIYQKIRNSFYLQSFTIVHSNVFIRLFVDLFIYMKTNFFPLFSLFSCFPILIVFILPDLTTNCISTVHQIIIKLIISYSFLSFIPRIYLFIYLYFFLSLLG